jgi:exopolysaccharide biosynthesis predicted pyruvyltransferase EpsI
VVLLLGSPDHGNLGDHAQTYCLEALLGRGFPDRRVVTFDMCTLLIAKAVCLRLIAWTARPDDAVFLHSGYRTTDVWPTGNRLNTLAARLFSEHRLVILPQSVYFARPANLQATAAVFNAHGDLTFYCRDRRSVEIARETFHGCDVRLVPDVVTVLVGARSWDTPRAGILRCLRDDPESVLDSAGQARLAVELGRYGRVRRTDTTSPLAWPVVARGRRRVLEDYWQMMAAYRVVVTDRFHGVVFSLITSTPVVVLPTSDHKVAAGLEWFGPAFDAFVYRAGSVREVPGLVGRCLAGGQTPPSAPDTLRRQWLTTWFLELAEVAR